MTELPEIPGEDREDEVTTFEEEGDAFAPEEETVAKVEAEAEDVDTDAEIEGEATEDEPDHESFAEKAKQWDAWGERFARDPAGFMNTFFNAMPDEAKAQFLAATGQKAPEAEAEPEYEPQSDIETLYLKERKEYASDRKALKDIPKFAETVNREFTVRDQFINDVSIQSAVHEAKLDAILELLDAKFPDLDRAAIQKTLLTGKSSYAEAVTKHYKPALEKAVKTTKQTAKPRPNTPANGSNSTRDLSNVKDMTKLFKLMGA